MLITCYTSKAYVILFRFLRAKGGNLTITFAFASIPILFALGATADYGYAVKTRARINAAADAAALAAVTPQMMSQDTAIAKQVATQMFLSQVSGLPRLHFDPVYFAANGVSIGDENVANQRVRTVAIRYKATSQTAFTNIIHIPEIAISGSSTSTASTPPNIDFYLMLDSSPSMAIPATQEGINWMVQNTPSQPPGYGGGCAFACHEKNPSTDSLSNPGGVDNYQLAKAGTLSNGGKIVLRMDLVSQAVGNLVDTARSSAHATGAAYRLAGYTFDASVNVPMPLQTPTDSSQSQAAKIQLLEVDSENMLNGINNNDQDTNFDAAFSKISGDMNAANNGAGPGTGTNRLGDSPQQVLMIVTDGVADESFNGPRIYTPLGGTTALRTESTDWCSRIKSNANVRIAVLYLVYNPLPMIDGYPSPKNNRPSWYSGHVAPEQTAISPTLQNCASTPSLFFQVNTGGDVTNAMNTLFRTAVKSAHLTN